MITLQNPHGLPPASVPSSSNTSKKATAEPGKGAVLAKPVPGGVAAVKEKEKLPCECYLYICS